MPWILVGIVVVGGTFVAVFSTSGDTWQALNIAGLLSAGFVLFIVIYATRKPFPAKQRSSVIFAVVLGILITGGTWQTTYQRSQLQSSTFATVRSDMERDLLGVYLMSHALEALREYHLKSRRSKESLDELFRRLHPQKFSEPAVFDTLPDGERFYLVAASDSMLVLVGQSDYVLGADAAFQNHDGRHGRMQLKTTVTERGIKSEIEN